MSLLTIRRKIPIITHIQFAVAHCIHLKEPVSGKELRGKLKEVFGINKSGPSFYQLMARLEQNKLITGWYKQEIVESQIIKERVYKLTANGEQAYQDAQLFYEVVR